MKINIPNTVPSKPFRSMDNYTADLPFGKKKAMVYIMDLKRKPGRPNAINAELSFVLIVILSS